MEKENIQQIQTWTKNRAAKKKFKKVMKNIQDDFYLGNLLQRLKHKKGGI